MAQLAGHWPLPELDSPFLGSSARRTMLATFEALLPDPTQAEGCTADLDAFLATSDPVVGGQLVLGLGLLEHWGGAGLLSFSRFSRLSIDERLGVLEDWSVSRLAIRRQIATALRKAVMFTWYSRPET